MAFRSLSEDIKHLQHLWSNKQGTKQQVVERFVSELPGVVHQGGFLIQNRVPGPLIEAVDPADLKLKYGLAVDEPGKLRLYIPDKDIDASLNLSVMKDGVNRKFQDIVELKKQSGDPYKDGGYSLKLNNVNEVTMNGQTVDMQKVVDRLQFQTHVDRIFTVNSNGTSTTPFVTFNPDNRSVGISALDPKGRLTLGTGGGAGVKGGDMVFEVGNTHDGQNPGFSAINWNGYYDRGEQVFDSERARWRVGVMPDDRFFIDSWKRGMGAPRTVIRASANDDVVDINDTLRISGKYSGWAETHNERAELVVDKMNRGMMIMPPKSHTTSQREIIVKGGLIVDDKLRVPELTIGKSDGPKLNISGQQGIVKMMTESDVEMVQNNNARIKITREGRVGINTTTPGSHLHVNGSVQIGGFLLGSEDGRFVVRNAVTNAQLALF